LKHSLLRSESSMGAKVPWNESSTGAKVLSMDFSLPGTKVQRNEKARYRRTWYRLVGLVTYMEMK